MRKFFLHRHIVQAYAFFAPAKSGVGIGVLENIRAHNRAYAVFLCVKHGHIRIMVGRVGAEQSAPGSRMTGYANPARLTTLEIGVSGGEFKHLSFEADIMSTTPTPLYPNLSRISAMEVHHA